MASDASVALNCSAVLGHLETQEQLAAARRAGYQAVEFWWPFADEDPSRSELDRFVSMVEESGLALVLLNFFDGGPDVGAKGLASVPGHEARFFDAAKRAVELGSRLGVRVYNPMYGLTAPGLDPVAQAELAIDNLARIAPLVAEAGAELAIEALSGIDRYPLRTGEDVMDVVAAVRSAGHPGIGMLADLFHLSENGVDVGELIRLRASDFSHVQIADSPGRTRPGEGILPLAAWVESARTHGYRGWVGIEYLAPDTDERLRGPLDLLD